MRKRLSIKFSTMVVIFFFCPGISNVKSQISTPQFIIPSASSYSLGKYGEIPVGTYTGVPDINIPLISFSQNELSVNVSLSYHGGGIKVDEIASWVGLGWSLNAGGTITRVVRGRPEYLLSNGEHRPIRHSIKFFQLPGDRTDYIAQSELDALAGGSLDGEPDEFFFNFQGRNGRFWFNKDGNPVLNKNEALDIDWVYVSSTESKFVIKDEAGTTYEFGIIEYTWFSEFSQNCPTAWHLTKIISSNGNEINFEYHIPISVTQSIRPYTEYMASAIDNALYPPPYTDFGLPQTEVFLKKISNRNGWIEFIRSNVKRLDYRTTSFSYALDEIRVFNRNDAPIKKYKFYTSYFEANDARKYDGPSPVNYAHLNYRLRLDSVAEYASDFMTSKPATQFYYLGDNNPATDDIYTLPYRLSPEQDHWGYYNRSGSSHIIPAPPANNSNINLDLMYEYFAIEDCSGLLFSFSNGSNRNPDTAAMKACSLNLIRYPTGGSMLYTFESNYSEGIFYHGGLRIKSIQNNPDNGTPSETKFDYGSGVATANPIHYYFTKYCISYLQGEPALNSTFLQNFGLPDTNPGHPRMKYLRIKVFPQAVLGNGAQFGYGNVTVSQTGNGYSRYYFAEAGEFPDYIDNENLSESPKLSGLYRAQFITDWPNPFTGFDGADFLTSIRVTDFPGLPLYSNDWKRGVLRLKEDYSENNVKIRSETYQYTRTFLDTIAGVKSIKMTALPEYISAKYYVPHALIQKVKDIIVVYDQDGLNPVTTTTDYYYDNANHLQTTRIITTNSKGEKESVYMKYPLDYGLTGTVTDITSQGVKLLQDNHLINPVIEKYIQKSNQDNSNLRTTSASFTTFKSDRSLPDKVYNWEPTQLPGNFIPTVINESSVNKSTDYNPHITHVNFDSNGNLIEKRVQDNAIESYTWDYSLTYPTAKVFNAPAKDIFYTSFEEDGDSNESRTGRKSKTGGFTKSLTGLTPGVYILSYWRKPGSTWEYVQSEQTVAGSSFNISLSGHIDEVRFYPKNARMTTYTYDPLIGMTSQCDISNRITYYEYDDFGRLYLIRDHNRNIVKKICYNYAGQEESCLTYGNQPQSQSIQREGCTGCLVGSYVTYTVPADTYFAFSQAAANTLAQNDISANGQAYANTNGSCVTPPNAGANAINNTTASVSLTFTNTCTSANYYYTVNANSSASFGPFPEGTYYVNMSSSQSSNFMINGYSQSGVFTAFFYNIQISGGASVTIND